MPLLKLPRELAIPRPSDIPNTDRLLRALINRLISLLSDIVERLNLVLDGYSIGYSTLPDADESHRGRLTWLKATSGQTDALQFARKEADNTYRWVGIPISHTPRSELLFGEASFDPPLIPAGGSVAATLPVTGAQPGDLVVATHSALPAASIMVTGFVESPGTVRVIFKNESGVSQDIPAGLIRVMVVKF
jgi:hypothetical protein